MIQVCSQIVYVHQQHLGHPSQNVNLISHLSACQDRMLLSWLWTQLNVPAKCMGFFWVVHRPYQIVYLILPNPVRPCTLLVQLTYCVPLQGCCHFLGDICTNIVPIMLVAAAHNNSQEKFVSLNTKS